MSTTPDTVQTMTPPDAGSTKVVAFMNPEGSMGKSTCVASLAYLLAQQGHRVLVVDLDVQANVTDWLGGARSVGITQALQATGSNLPSLWPDESVENLRADLCRQSLRAVQHTASGVDLLASDHRLGKFLAGWNDTTNGNGDQLLVELFAALAGEYDHILCDCKGDMNALNLAALLAATDVVGVTDPTMKGLKGIIQLQAVCERHQARMRAVVPNKVRHRNASAVADDIYQDMLAQWPMTPPVRGAAGLDLAGAHGEPVAMWDPRLAISADLAAVVRDLQDRGVF